MTAYDAFTTKFDLASAVAGVGDEPVLAGPTLFADTPRIIWVGRATR